MTPFLVTPFEDTGAVFSPNGRWVAYVSNKSGQPSVYARPYPGPGSEVTIAVGQEPVWGPSGRELFYRHDGKLMSVRVEESAASLTVGAPTPVFDDPYRLDTSSAQGGNFGEGLRALVIGGPAPVTLVNLLLAESFPLRSSSRYGSGMAANVWENPHRL